jgi:hypothetical protein
MCIAAVALLSLATWLAAKNKNGTASGHTSPSQRRTTVPNIGLSPALAPFPFPVSCRSRG